MSIVEFLSQPLWQRLGLTLVHFLWQGLAVAVLVGVLVRVFRLNHGNARYAAYLLAFIAMMVCPVVTFTAIDIPISPNTELVTGAEFPQVVDNVSYTVLPAGDILPEAETSSPVIPTSGDSIPLGQRISGWLNVSMPWVLVIWMVGVIVLSVRLLMGFVGVYRWRHHLEPLPERLAQRIPSLSERLGMRGFSGVFISPAVLQAMAVGYLRPMVLLPVAMVTEMQPEMLEAVMAHELAHIRRFDLWINLAQRVTETLLFYHPAVWWLSICLRNERELCCDELAVKATGERITYASTLERVGRARFMAKPPVLAAGLGHDNKPTLSRVRHILGLTPTQRNCPFWLAGVITVLFLAVLVIPTTLALTSRTNEQAEIQEEKNPKQLSTFTRTLPNGVTVELVGICEYPSAGKQWWRPDGSPFTLPAGVKVEDRISKARVGDNAYQFLFRYDSQEYLVWNSLDAVCLHFSIEGHSDTDLINLSRLPEGGQDGLVAKVAIFKETLDSTTVQANLATGDWQTQAVRDISKIDERNEDLYWFTSQSAGSTSLDILHRIEGQQIKTIAIDREGNEYGASYSLGSFNGWASISQIDGRRYVAGLRKDDRLVKFKLQSRPFGSSVIGNVSLKPNFKTAGQVVVEGILANRAKFECGYLAWSSEQITTRFADSGRPATELAGQYELWWDGKKMATKYVRDEVHKDPEGNFSVEKGQGGDSYDGGVLSRKPDFRDNNWLGPQITRWSGPGSQDWLIQQDSKQKGISKDWSVVDTNGVKLIRFTVKNMNETDRDYGGYSIIDYDPSKGYGLVNEEWYNPNGSPRLKHTVKMLEVIPGGWFPVEVDFKSFAITDGKVYSHNHCALDIERCSFNDRAALPDRVFKWAVDKQLKYQEKLQSYLAMELEGISDVKEAAKADKVKLGAREAVEKFVAAALAGDFEKARQLADPNKAVADQVADMPEILQGQNLWIMAVVADDFDAIAVSSVIRGDHDRIGPLVFFLDRKPQDGRDNWWVDDIDLETPDGAEVGLKRFLEKHPEAKKVPSENKPAVQVEGENRIEKLDIETLLAKVRKALQPTDNMRVSW